MATGLTTDAVCGHCDICDPLEISRSIGSAKEASIEPVIVLDLRHPSDLGIIRLYSQEHPHECPQAQIRQNC